MANKAKPLQDSVRLPRAISSSIGRDMRVWLRRFLSALKFGFIWIQDRDTGELIRFVPRHSQVQVLSQMIAMADEGVPIRVLIPKSRRQGISTLIQALFGFLCANIENFNSLTVAHTHLATAEIFQLGVTTVKRMPNHGIHASSAKSIRFSNGSRYQCVTAGAKGVSRGSTVHALHLSEVASYQSVSGMDSKALTSLLNTVALSPHTIVVMESTGEGPSGEFYERCQKANGSPGGRGKDGYQLIFLPWHFDEDSQAPPLPLDTYSESDKALQVEFNLSDGQMAFYKKKYYEAVAGGSQAFFFAREWPSRLMDCFTGATGLVYPNFGTKNIREIPREVFVDENGRGRGNWKLYRSIDWGWSQDPFAVAWVANDPDAPPMLTVDPACENTIKEFQSYKFDARRDKPAQGFDHLMDCTRMVVCSFRLKGHVHIYREIYVKNAVLERMDGIARMIHQQSGYDLPDKELDLSKAVPIPHGVGEKYNGTVADRSQPQSIQQFSTWGIQCVGQVRPPMGSKSKGEILDGIAMVSTMLGGVSRLDRNPDTSYKTTLEQAWAEATGRAGLMGRPCSLPEARQKVLDDYLSKQKRPTDSRARTSEHDHLYV